MKLADPREIRRVAAVGVGVIGRGWTAHFLRMGLDVIACDPAPESEQRLRRAVDDTWPTLERLGLAPGATPGRLCFAPDIASAVEQAQFVQENVPESQELKTNVLCQIAAAAPASTVIASSTSGIPMTEMQPGCAHPERCIVGHPFTPPYLVPLVEVVPGKQTAAEVTAWTVDFYAAMGKQPLRLDRELPGFLADRLLEAVWCEALHLIARGEATVEEIDAAMVHGPGLRWAVLGPCLTYHLGGGDGGMEHFLDQFGSALELPWSFMDAPALTPALREQLVEGCRQAASGRSVRGLEQERDDCLIRILAALEDCRSKKR
jgi:carnitine 3-dehydrogenase